MEGFPFVYREQVRFRDIDAMGDVNNAVFLTYMESARTAFLFELGLVRRLEDVELVIGRIEVDFRSPVMLGEAVDVGVRAGRFGTRSFDLEYRLAVGDRLVAEGKSVCVGYDYSTRTTRPIPDGWRKVLAA